MSEQTPSYTANPETVSDYRERGAQLQAGAHRGICVPGSCCLACADFLRSREQERQDANAVEDAS